MNYRLGDIIEIMHNNNLVTAKIVSFDKKCKYVNVVLHNSKRKESNTGYKYRWNYTYYPEVSVPICDIIRVVKRKRGKGYKKKYNIILIDKDGNITDK